MITEIGLMGSKPSTNIMSPTTPEGKIMTSTYTSIFNQPTGPKNVYWGVQIEDPLNVWALFDWESLEEHESFAKTFGAEAVKDLPKILTHGIFTKHISLLPCPAKALQTPVTSFVLTYFPSSLSSLGKESIFEKVKENLGLESGLDGKEVSIGWGLENDFPILGSGEGEEGKKGCVLMIFIGWGSLERSEGFKGKLGVFEGVEGVIGKVEGSVRFRCLLGDEK